MASHRVTSTSMVFVIEAVDRPRTVPSIVSLIAGRGHHLRWLRSAPAGAGSVLVSCGLDVEECVAHRLALQLERIVEVLSASTVPARVADLQAQVQRYEVNVRGGRRGLRSEAVVAVDVDGVRRLGAGEGFDSCTALAAAVAAAHRGFAGEPSLGSVEVVPDGAGWTAVVRLVEEGERLVASRTHTSEEVAVIGAALAAVDRRGKVTRLSA